MMNAPHVPRAPGGKALRRDSVVKVSLGWQPAFEWSLSRAWCRALGRYPAARIHDAVWQANVSLKLRSLLQMAERQPADQFVIAGRAGQHFMQCLWRPMGWRLEKREWREDRHFVAAVKNAERWADDVPEIVKRILLDPLPVMSYLDLAQVNEAMLAYLLERPDPDWLAWHKIKV